MAPFCIHLGYVGVYIGRMEKRMETTIMGYIGIMKKEMEITIIVFWGVCWGYNWGYMCQSGFAFWSAASEDPGKGGAVFALCDLQSKLLTRDYVGEYYTGIKGDAGSLDYGSCECFGFRVKT